jgi:hypothetical protein
MSRHDIRYVYHDGQFVAQAINGNTLYIHEANLFLLRYFSAAIKLQHTMALQTELHRPNAL